MTARRSTPWTFAIPSLALFGVGALAAVFSHTGGHASPQAFVERTNAAVQPVADAA